MTSYFSYFSFCKILDPGEASTCVSISQLVMEKAAMNEMLQRTCDAISSPRLRVGGRYTVK